MGDGPLGPDSTSTRTGSLDVDACLGVVFDTSATAMCLVDSEGTIRRANEAMCTLVARSQREVVGSAWTELSHREDAATESARLREIVSGHIDHYCVEKRLTRRDGSIVWSRVTGSALRDAASPGMFLIEAVDTTTERVLVERSRASDERIRLTVSAAQDAFVAMDASGRITQWNDAAETIFGWPADEAIGRRLAATIIPEDQREAHERGLAHYLEVGEGRVLNKKVEVKALRRDGTEFLVELTIWPVAGSGGVEFNAFLRDVSERLRFQEELRRLAIAATTDQVTGLKNRRGFFPLAQHELSIAQRLGHSLTLIFFDLDGLKEINDTLGHLEGDRAIADTARVLTSTFRESDLIARLGGDEFCVLALGPPEGFTQTMRRFQDAVDEHNRTKGRSYVLSLSYGVAFFDPRNDVVSLDELMSRADASMYESKLPRRSA